MATSRLTVHVYRHERKGKIQPAAQAGRDELAERERAELAVLERYLPAQLTDQELAELVARTLAAGEFCGPAAMGAAMKAVRVEVAGRADGARVAAEVRHQLST